LTSPYAGEDVPDLCENSILLSGSALGTGETGIWTIQGGPDTEVFSDPSVNNPLVSNLRQGLITFYWTVWNADCSVTDAVSITNNTPRVDAGTDSTICGDAIRLYGNAPGAGESGWWQIGDPFVIVNDSTQYNTNVSNLGPNNEFTWTVDNGLCTATDTVRIISNKISVTAGSDGSGCLSSIPLNATPVPGAGQTGFWSRTAGTVTFANSLANATTAMNMVGFNTLRWTIVEGSCEFYDEFSYTSLLPTEVANMADTAICTDSITLLGTQPGIGETGLWTQTGGPTATIVDNTSFQTEIKDLASGESRFTWTISNGSCISSDEVIVTNNQIFADAGEDKLAICDSTWSLAANVVTGSGVWTTTASGVIIDKSQNPNHLELSPWTCQRL
jgi:hypothetical protein